MNKSLCLLIWTLGLVLACGAGVPLPPGMARADDPEQVAALEARTGPAPATEENAKDKTPSEQEAYQQQRIAYLTRLQQEQHERKELEAQLEREREARRLAEQRAAEAERQRRREEIYILHHTVHAYQRHLNEEYEREQRLRRILCEERRRQPCLDREAEPDSCHQAVP